MRGSVNNGKNGGIGRAIRTGLKKRLGKEPDGRIVEELSSAVEAVMECVSLSEEFGSAGLDKRRWYETTILSSASGIAYQCCRQEAALPASQLCDMVLGWYTCPLRTLWR